jgi:hypothetical protein
MHTAACASSALAPKRDRPKRQELGSLAQVIDHGIRRQQINALESAGNEIGLTQDQFRSAISCTLEILGAPSFEPSPSGSDQGPPASPSRRSTPPGAETLDTLRALRPRGQKFWDWRRTSPLRPVIFEDPGVVTEDTVQLDLEHRAGQRLLGRFISQGFVHHDLSRACLAQSSGAIPRVLLLGRLALYGPGPSRLHEELVPPGRFNDLLNIHPHTH